MRKVTEQFFCDICKKEAYYCETISVGIEPRDGLSGSAEETSLMKAYEICQDCYDKKEVLITLKWKTVAHDDSVGKCVQVKSFIKI